VPGNDVAASLTVHPVARGLQDSVWVAHAGGVGGMGEAHVAERDSLGGRTLGLRAEQGCAALQAAVKPTRTY